MSSPKYSRELGTLLGYPECCISAFINHELPPTIKPWFGTGYRPCIECLKKDSAQLVKEINSRRVQGIPPYTTCRQLGFLLVYRRNNAMVLKYTTSREAFLAWRKSAISFKNEKNRNE